MSAILAARIVLAVLAVAAVRRARGPRGTTVAGIAGAAAAFGPSPAPLPPPELLAALLAGAALLLALFRADVHPPLASEAALSTAALAAGALGVSLVALRACRPVEALAAGGAIAGALSVWGAEGCRANAEAGWRRSLAWGSAVVLPGLVAASVLALVDVLPPRLAAVAPATALLVALLAWLPPFLLERRRVRLELKEEARLGILPDEDLAVLGNPWRRSREARFGRADERREYVRSALLLAIARQQQRRRSGEAIRLRQLEVLAFRTRVRRAVEGRASRFAGLSDEPST